MKYKVVQQEWVKGPAIDLPNFELKVNNCLAEGWKLQGVVSIAWVGSDCYTWAQAVVKE